MCLMEFARVSCAIVNGVLYPPLATRGDGQHNLSGPRGLITNTDGNIVNVQECSKHLSEVTGILSTQLFFT